MAVILGRALTFPRRRLAVNPTGLPLQVVIFPLAMDIAALALAANAIVVPGEQLAAVYAAAVTAILIGAGMLFLFTSVYWYDATSVTSSRNRKSGNGTFRPSPCNNSASSKLGE